MGVISGITTNPVLIRKEGAQNKLREHITSIRSICDGEILCQVISTNAEGMVRQAKEINSWCENMTIKIPLTQEGIKAVSILRRENNEIRTCNTITFSPGQALMAAMAGATYISPFYNRTNKDTNSGLYMVENIVKVFRANNVKTQIIAASIDGPMDVVNMALLGAEVITAPLKVWQSVLENSMTQSVLKKFLDGWNGDEF